MKMTLYVVLLIVGIFIVFILQNLVPVQIKFLFWGFELSRGLLYLIIFCFGVFLGSLVKKR